MTHKDKGLIHIYTGEGKGKTTAAVGLSVRMAGARKKVLFAQFMKGGESSEIQPLKALEIHVMKVGTICKFLCDMTEDEKKVFQDNQMDCFAYVQKNASDYDLVVLDEIISAVTTGMIPETALEQFLLSKPDHTEVVLTGRNAPESIEKLADYVSSLQCIRHPYEKGVLARKGIEF